MGSAQMLGSREAEAEGEKCQMANVVDNISLDLADQSQPRW
jgi:hypothetical protein